jgi:hypothetical protein
MKKYLTRRPINTIFLRGLIVCNILAFVYYCYDLLYLNIEKDFIDYSPLLGIALSVLVFVSIKRTSAKGMN